MKGGPQTIRQRALPPWQQLNRELNPSTKSHNENDSQLLRSDTLMQQVTLVSGPPGCGKTAWALEALRAHEGQRSFLRLAGDEHQGLQQGQDSGIDLTWLQDQLPNLQSPLDTAEGDTKVSSNDELTVIEVQQFRPPPIEGMDGYGAQVKALLERLNLKPNRFLHFGRDQDLPTQDTLEFSHLESWHQNLQGCVWDPDSLSSFWFELVNGAYGDVYRAKALMNLPDGRSFFCNWMVSQKGSQFLPLETIAVPQGRPNRCSELVVQGRALNPAGIQSTLNDCLLSDDVLEMQQQQLRNQQPTPQRA